jgi:hypothetical protein
MGFWKGWFPRNMKRFGAPDPYLHAPIYPQLFMSKPIELGLLRFSGYEYGLLNYNHAALVALTAGYCMTVEMPGGKSSSTCYCRIMSLENAYHMP